MKCKACLDELHPGEIDYCEGCEERIDDMNQEYSEDDRNFGYDQIYEG